MKTTPRPTHLATLFTTVVALTACGGGGGDPPAAPPPPAPATTANITTTVIDGPLQNATVCLDTNNNGACDVGEPSARTAADGSATLTVPIADAGLYPLVAVVGTDAVDSVSGPVTVPYVLSAPADRTGVVSPLSTLVKTRMDTTGSSSAEAERALQENAGSAVPMLTNYSASNSSDAEAAATTARLIVVAMQAARTALLPALGTPDSSGAAITATDIERAVNRRLVELLPSIANTTGQLLDVASGAAREAATHTAGQSLGTTELALTPSTLGWVLGFARNADTSATTPTAGASLDWFTYNDAANWYYRWYESTAAQNTPDTSGLLRFSEKRKRALSGVVQNFGDAAYARTDVYFNGTQWFSCPADFEQTQTQRNADGVNESRYCGSFHNSTRRSAGVDIAGRTLSEVVALIRAYPLVSSQGLYNQWGPDPATPALSGVVFPAGSKLFQNTSTQLANPDSHGTLDNQIVKAFTPEVAAGGTPVFTNGVPSLACGNVTPANAASYQSEIQTLEQLVAGNPGRPCNFPPNASTGPRHEWWSNSTIGLGTIGGTPPVLPYYQANRALRIAFGAGNAVTYYNCALRASDSSTRNCDAIGTGSYSIEVLGDARVMRFAGVPGAARALTYNRLFVERGGKVYFGFRTKLGVDNTLRLNAPALDALLAPLGLTR